MEWLHLSYLKRCLKIEAITSKQTNLTTLGGRSFEKKIFELTRGLVYLVILSWTNVDSTIYYQHSELLLMKQDLLNTRPQLSYKSLSQCHVCLFLLLILFIPNVLKTQSLR